MNGGLKLNTSYKDISNFVLQIIVSEIIFWTLKHDCVLCVPQLAAQLHSAAELCRSGHILYFLKGIAVHALGF